ncbi:putative pectate lyase 18 [Hibiscus syriacus]|uniref:Pectate lyase n=1 Tax=Hibiscus syriacus TaxID=106335 RepID=A0A6A3ARW6_HIBSY|nr:putative pectate lyase 18 [Hibiscus syriacus]
MPIHPLSLLFIFTSLLIPSLTSSSPVQDPELVVEDVHRAINASRRNLGFLSCGTGNPIDDCWRCDPNWEKNRQRLADCAIGFGKNAIGGRDGQIYVVTDSSDNDVEELLMNSFKTIDGRGASVHIAGGPCITIQYVTQHFIHGLNIHDCKQGGNAMVRDSPKHYGWRTLSDGDGVSIFNEPLWIIFPHDMTIRLKEELLMNSFKTIDGRGASVHIAGGPCITIQYVTNIIIHGLNIHDCKQGGNAMVRDSPKHYGWRTLSDGDGVSIFGGSHVWVDHNSLSNCNDGLVDAIHGSTAITISNNYMTHHDKVMLLGHNVDMDIFTWLTMTTPWEMYAIGGSANPTINSQGNRFTAPDARFSKEVTKHEDAPESDWKNWNWRSEGDLMVNGAFFTASGAGASSSYAKASSLGC